MLDYNKMELHRRKHIVSGSSSSSSIPQIEENDVLKNRVNELETLVTSLKEMLAISRNREKRLAAGTASASSSSSSSTYAPLDYMTDLEDPGGGGGGRMHLFDEKDAKIKSDAMNVGHDIAVSNIFTGLQERAGWLIGLLVFQSCSSFILAANEDLLSKHPAIIYFLTMLVGSGGNAGSQSAVRVIRGLALGTLSNKTYRVFLFKEFCMAATLSVCIGLVGLLRSLISSQTSYAESIAITATLIVIVFVSIVLGAVLPLLLHYINVDPAHSGTSIQVIMDILGVFITCIVATTILDSNTGKLIMKLLGLL